MALTSRSYKGSIKNLSGDSNHPDYKASAKKDSVNVVAFDREGEDWGVLSNYAEVPIKMGTPFGMKVFPTVEHYFQYQKDPNDANYLNNILNGDAQNARNLGQTKKWSDFKLADQAIQRAIQAKLENPQVQQVLKQTGDACLVEDTGSRSPRNQDGNWGWKQGGDIAPHSKTGNKLGILLMEERNRLHIQDNNLSMIVHSPRDLSERARGIMTRNYPHTDLINLSKTLQTPQSAVPEFDYPSSRLKTNLNHATGRQTFAVESNKEVSSLIRSMLETPPATLDLPMVSKGLMKGSFKIAFDNPQEAQAFKNLLRKDGFETSYYGDEERFPMQCSGKTLNHIVRFENTGEKTEIPKEALAFLNQKFKDENKVAEIVEKMGFEKPQVELAHSQLLS